MSVNNYSSSRERQVRGPGEKVPAPQVSKLALPSPPPCGDRVLRWEQPGVRSMQPGTRLCHCQPSHASLLPFTCVVGTEQGPLAHRDRRLWAAGAQALPGGGVTGTGRKEGNSKKLLRVMLTLGSLSGRGEGSSGYQGGVASGAKRGTGWIIIHQGMAPVL